MVEFALESYHLQIASTLRARQALSVTGTHLVRLAEATFCSDFTSPDADFDSAIVNLVGSSSQPDSATWSPRRQNSIATSPSES